MKFLYQVGILLYWYLIQIISLWSFKARKFVHGRMHFDQDLKDLNKLEGSRIWFHFPSLGEFEQGRTVLERWKSIYPDEHIIITFFSPSGFEIRKNYSLASGVYYLPMDTGLNAHRFIEALKPQMAVFTKYDYWYFFFHELRKRKIPVVVISAIFRKSQVYFNPHLVFFSSILKCVNWFFVQDEGSKDLLSGLGIHTVSIAGDTRFDRVFQISQNPQINPDIVQFVGNSLILIAGSTWPEDEENIENLMKKDFMAEWKCILVPHETDESHISGLIRRFKGIAVPYSNWIKLQEQKEREVSFAGKVKVLIIDRIGLLSSLYRLGTVTYIGGGFGSGIHNSLEAAIFGKPIVFGPNFKKFKEAVDFIQLGAALTYTNAIELEKIANDLLSIDRRLEMGKIAQEYCLNHVGATDLIMDKLVEIVKEGH